MRKHHVPPASARVGRGVFFAIGRLISEVIAVYCSAFADARQVSVGRQVYTEYRTRPLSRKMMESMRGSTQGIFDQVRKSSLELGDSWRQLERLTKASTISKNITPAFETKSLEFSNHMAEHTARMARERTEDREMLRLTAETSAKSAKTLQELADAASMMLEKLDERDADAKRTTKTQLWIAVGSVAVSAILAGASFIQDRTSNKSGDEWQLAVLSELKASNERGASIQTENQLLRDQVLRLSSTIAVLEGKINTLPVEAKQVSTSKKRR